MYDMAKLLKRLGLKPKEIKRWKNKEGVRSFDRHWDNGDSHIKDYEEVNSVSESGGSEYGDYWYIDVYLYRKGESYALRVDDYMTGAGSDSFIYLFD